MTGSIKNLPPSATPLRPQRTQGDVEAKVREVSQLYEKQFLREMVKAMRQTVSAGGLIPEGPGQKIFQEQLDQEYVEAWGDRGGVGMSDLIYQQLMQQVSPSKHLPKVAPMPLREIRQVEMTPQLRPDSRSGSLRLRGGPVVPSEPSPRAPGGEPQRLKPEKANLSPTGRIEIFAPHDGVVQATRGRADGTSELVVKAWDGLQSRLMFSGPAINREPGATVVAGQRIGWSEPTTWVQWDWQWA